MKLKKVLGLSSAFVLSASVLAGCGGPASSTSTISQTNLTFWIFDNPPMVQETKKLVASYQQEHPNVKVDLQVMPNDQYSQKYTVALGTHTGPDVLLISDRSIPTLVQKKVLAPINPTGFGFKSQDELKSNWLGGSLEGLSQKGQIYGIPMEFDTFSLFINTKAFKEAGLDPVKDAPKTWDQVQQVASKLTIRKNNQLVQAGFAWPMFNGGWEALVMDPMVRQLGGSFIQDYGKTANFNSSQVKQVFQTWSDMYNKYHTMDLGFGTSSSTNPNQSFADGKVAMWISGPWAIPTITKDSAAYNNYEVVPFPQFDPGHPVSMVYSWNWAVNSATEHSEESWNLVNYLSNHEKEWLQTCGYIQPRKGWMDDPEVQKFPFINVWTQDMQKGHYIMRSDQYAPLSDIVGRAVDAVLKEHKSVDEALQKAQTDAEKALNG